MEQYDFKDSVITTLKKILTEIEAYEVLPDPGSPEADAMGEEWRAKFDEINEKKLRAINLTVILLPSDVGEIVTSIKQAAHDRQMGVKREK